MTRKIAARGDADLYAAISLIRLLFHRFAAVADAMHRARGITAAQRGVLETLVEAGPATVPAMARGKSVTRQHVQTIVNALVAAGLASFSDNPAHRRSQLVRATAPGARAFHGIRTREDRALKDLARKIDARRLALTLATLRELASLTEARRGRPWG